MRAYFNIAKMRLLIFLTYRFEVLSSLGTSIILLVSNIFLWKAAYSGIGSVKGVDEAQMTAYVSISVLLSSFFSATVEQRLPERIGTGDIAIDFFRPINPILAFLAEDVGIAVSSLISRLIPLLAFMLIFFEIPLPASAEAFAVFVVCTVFSFLLLWQISALIAMLCFWFLQLGNLGTIKDGIVLLLSGRFIPLWLFPKEAQDVVSLLPFQYIYQTPLNIYIGQTKSAEYAGAIIVQLVWNVLLAALLSLVWKRAKRKVMVQGG